MIRLLAFLASVLASAILAQPAQAVTSDCLAMAEAPARVRAASFSPAALEADQVQLTFLGHATFLIETAGGVKIATDYTGYAGGVTPDVVTMNRAHHSHYTDAPDPAIKHVLRG